MKLSLGSKKKFFFTIMFIWRIRTQIAQNMGPNHSNNDLEEQMSKEFDLVFTHLQQDGVFAYSIWLSFIGVLRLQIHVSILEMGFWNGSKLWILTIASSAHGSYIIYQGKNSAFHIGLGHGKICVNPWWIHDSICVQLHLTCSLFVLCSWH